MTIEKLQIADPDFMITRLVQQTPKSTMLREFVKNADENASTGPAENRVIKIYPVIIDDVFKIAFYNTGTGMTDEELVRATNFSSSVNKTMGLNDNFGIGAKVSGLSVSPEGIRYRSCKDGVVHQVIIALEGTAYCRVTFELTDGKTDSVLNVTETVLSEGLHSLKFDWTEVVLFGEDMDHDTVRFPLGKNKKLKHSYIASEIFKRFAHFESGANVIIDTTMSRGHSKGDVGKTRTIKTLEELLPKLPQSERITLDKYIIHFIHDPKGTKESRSLSALANPAASSTTFCALVYKGERYDYKTQSSWSVVAPKFGIPFGSKVLSVEIEIPENTAYPDQYRTGLTWPDDKSPMGTDDFCDLVREAMPEWVKDIIRDQSPKSDTDLSELQSELQKLLNEYRKSQSRLSPKPNENTFAANDDNTADLEKKTVINADTDIDLNTDPQIDITKPVDPITRKPRLRVAPAGATASKLSKYFEQAPRITILDVESDIKEKELQGRAGRFYKDINEIFVNGLYSSIDILTDRIVNDLSGGYDAEDLRTAALDAARTATAYLIGKNVVLAISKKDEPYWTNSDFDAATSRETLTMFAEDFAQVLLSAKKRAVNNLKKMSIETVKPTHMAPV